MKTVVVTGGAGFVGSNLVRQWLDETNWRIVCVDRLSYAGQQHSIDAIGQSPRFEFCPVDVCDAAALAGLLPRVAPDAIVHLAAETHVDRSIDEPMGFIRNNVLGTGTLLEAARHHWQALPQRRRKDFRVLQTSTDEVFGSLGSKGKFDEASQYSPNSPYSASKAAADHLVRAWHSTYGLPVVVSHGSNIYGPRQFPEKLIPLTITNALQRRPLPVYGDGRQIRDWLFVDDFARALRVVLERGRVGESYCVGARQERSNLDVVHALCSLLDALAPAPRPHAENVLHVADRPGHDRRYATNPEKLEEELGWRPQVGFDEGLALTVRWYLDHPDWLDAARRHAAQVEGNRGNPASQTP